MTLPSRFHATPAEIDTYLRTILAEDVYLNFQQAIGEHAIGQTVEDVQMVRAAADNEGHFNNDWREGWDDVIDRIDPDRNGPYPAQLITFAEVGRPCAECPETTEAGRAYCSTRCRNAADQHENGGH